MSKLYFSSRPRFGGAAVVGLLALASQSLLAGALPHRALPQPLEVLRTQAISYSEAGAATLPTLPFVRRVLFDADGDGDQDLLYQNSANATGADIFLRVNNGSGDYSTTYAANASGTFTSGPLSGVTFTQVLTYTNNGGLSVVDIDNDGDQDLVEYTNATAPRVITNNRGTATASTSATLPTLAFGTRHVFYDVDGDGDQDILYQTSNSATGNDIALKLNGGNGTFSTTYAANASGTFGSGPLSGVTFTQVLPAASAGGLDPVDVDNDGDQDLVEYGNATAPRVILNNRGTSTAATSTPLPTLAFGTRHVFFDVDSDGDQDLLYQATANATGADIGLKLNNGSGNFTVTIAASASGTFSSGPLSGITFAQVLPGASSGGINPIDYDNDRDADVVIFTNATPTRVVRQESTRPLLVSSTPADNATGVSPSANLVLTFDRSVVKGSGNLYLVRTADNVIVETTAIGNARVTGAGTTWTYDPAITLAGSTSYALRADEGIFRDADNRAFAGIRDNTTLNFTTAATTTVASVNRAGSSPTNASSVSFTVTFAASVAGLSASNFSLASSGLTGATIASVAGSGTTYTVTVNTGAGDGTLGLNLDNATGLSPTVTNVPFTGQTYTIDKTAPVVTGVANGGLYNSNRTITFGEGTATLNGSAFSSGTTVTADGTYTLVVTDPASNVTTIRFTLDKTAPTVASLASTAGASGSTTNTAPLPFSVTFSEPVTGFVASGISVTNGAVTSNPSGSGSGPYTFSVTPTVAGTATTVTIAANAAQDAAGNGNTAAASPYTLTYAQPVTAAPVVTAPANRSFVTVLRPPYSGTAPVASTVTVYVDGTSIGTTSASGGSFSLVQPTSLSEGSHTVYATAQVSGSTVSANSNTNTFTVDTSLPTATITSSVGPSGSSTSTSPIPFTVTFSEPVTGFDKNDISFSGAASSVVVTATSASVYAVQVTPAAAGTLTLTVPAGAAQDAAGNGNAASMPFSVTYAQPVTAAPVVTSPANGSLFGTSTPTYAGTAPAGSTVVVYVDGSSIGTTTATGGSFNLAQPAALADGSHTVRATAQASGSTVSASSNTNTFTTDATPPAAVVMSPATSGSYTNLNPIPFTVTFSEPVTGFSASGLNVAGGTVSSFTPNANGTSYAVTVVPTASTVSFSVMANAAQDAAGNGNTASSLIQIVYVAPTTVSSIARLDASPTSAASVRYQVQFSSRVSGLTLNNFSLATTGLTGASLASLTGAGTVFIVTVNTGTGTGTLRLDLTDPTLNQPATIGNAPFRGEVYTIAPPACTAPTDIAVDQVNTTTARVSFTASATAGGYVVSYAPSSGLAQTVTATASPVQLIGLTPGTTYYVTVASQCGGGLTAASMPPVSFTTPLLRVPENPSGTTAGLAYDYYEASGANFTRLPTFASLTPTKSGTAPQVDVKSQRQRSYGYALRYTGYVTVPADGQYTFYTNSDDGSQLFIGSTLVVDNDGNHGTRELSGTIGLQAGTHALTITYYQDGGDDQLSVSYQGPGVAKQLIPGASLRVVLPTALRTPENPAGAVAGLPYQYYEAPAGSTFSQLPAFASLTPQQTGVAATFDVASQRQRTYGYALRYTGYVTVPTDGVYTFTTGSDDGSQLFIGSTLVVDNDGNHSLLERSGSIGLKAGTHALTVTYYQDGGGDQLNVSYEGPGLAKQLIPAASLVYVPSSPPAALRVPENPSGTMAGLRYQYYESATTYSQLPAFASETVRKSGTTTSFDERSLAQRSYGYALRYTGYVTVQADGQYTFFTNSDDGSQLFIGSTLVVDNDGNHDVRERSGTIGLQAGTHLLTVTYYQDGGGDQLSVSYQGPGVAKQLIPAASLRYVPASLASTTKATTRVLAAGEQAPLAGAATLLAYPNPFVTDVQIEVTLPSTGAYELGVYDVTGRLVEQLPGGTGQAGEQRQVRWAAGGYASGLYLLRLRSATATQQLRLTKQ